METEIETLFNINDCAALIFDSSEQKCIYNFNLKSWSFVKHDEKIPNPHWDISNISNSILTKHIYSNTFEQKVDMQDKLSKYLDKYLQHPTYLAYQHDYSLKLYTLP